MLRRKPARAKTAGRPDGAGASDAPPAAARHHHRPRRPAVPDHFTARPGAYVTLQTSAADAAGGSVTETIQHAYQVASRSANGAAR